MYLLAIVILDSDGCVIHANQSAKEMIGTANVIAVTRSNHLEFLDPGGHMLVRQARQNLFRHNHKGRPANVHVTNGEGTTRYSVSMVPLVATGREKHWAGSMGRGRGPLLAICIGHGPAERGEARQSLRQRFGLTPSESDAVWQLYEGLTPKQIADRREVSVHTVQNQIKAAHEKTETRRLNQLVRLAAEAQAANLLEIRP